MKNEHIIIIGFLLGMYMSFSMGVLQNVNGVFSTKINNTFTPKPAQIENSTFVMAKENDPAKVTFKYIEIIDKQKLTIIPANDPTTEYKAFYTVVDKDTIQFKNPGNTKDYQIRFNASDNYIHVVLINDPDKTIIELMEKIN